MNLLLHWQISSKECPKLMFKFSFEKKTPHKIEFFNPHTIDNSIYHWYFRVSVILRSGLQNIFPMCTKALWIQPVSDKKTLSIRARWKVLIILILMRLIIKCINVNIYNFKKNIFSSIKAKNLLYEQKNNDISEFSNIAER